MEDIKEKPKKRRPKGDGSIQKLANGKYKAQITVGYDSEGKQRKKSFTGNSQREVIKMLDEFKVQLSKGTLVLGNDCMVSEYIQRWLGNKQRELRETSYDNYLHICTKHILPMLGGTKMRKLTTVIINDYFASKMDEGLSPLSLRKHRNILSSMLDLAITEGVLTSNPSTRSNTLRAVPRKMDTLTPDEIKVVLGASREALDGHKKSLKPMYHIILLALATGMRIGELLGLQWKDVGDDSITIAGSLTHKKKLGLTKSASSNRTISVDAEVIKELPTGNGYVFKNYKGEPLYPCDVSRSFQEIIASCGIKGVRFHDLRHTHATQLIAGGCSIKMVSERLGHSSVGITLSLYVHSLPDQDREAANIMGKFLR